MIDADRVSKRQRDSSSRLLPRADTMTVSGAEALSCILLELS
jgi:hypothetical protein